MGVATTDSRQEWAKPSNSGEVGISARADSPSLRRSLQTGQMTIVCSLRLDKLDSPSPWPTVVAQGTDGAMRCYNLFWHSPTCRLLIAYGNGKGQFADVACTKTDWKAGQWYQVVVAHRRNDRTTQWWIDGQPAGEAKTPFDAVSLASRSPTDHRRRT